MNSDMRLFWDARADEDPFFFVDNRMQYGDPDLEAFWAGGETDLNRLLEAVGARLKPTDDVVEIGCGVGRLTRVLAHKAASVQALDISARMLTLAQHHNRALQNVEWLLSDGSTLSSVASNSADVCISHVVFQHIPDPAVTLGYIREIGRVLRVGGWSAFQVSNDRRVHNGLGPRKRIWQSALAALGRFPTGVNDRHWLGSMVDLESLRAAVIEGSMEVEQLVGEGTQFCCVRTRRR